MFSLKRFFVVFGLSSLFLGLVATIYLSVQQKSWNTRTQAYKLKTQVIPNSPTTEVNIDSGKPALLTVVGEGKVSATPEIVQFTISYSASGKTPTEAITNEKTTRQKILTLLSSVYGVDTSSVASLFPSIVQTGTSENISYSAVNSMNIDFKQLNSLDAAISQLYEIGNLSIGNIVYTTTNPRDLEDRAIANALADAQARAEKMAGSSGSSLGRLVSMTGQQTQAVGAVTTQNNKTGEGTGAPGKMEIIRMVTLVYEIK